MGPDTEAATQQDSGSDTFHGYGHKNVGGNKFGHGRSYRHLVGDLEDVDRMLTFFGGFKKSGHKVGTQGCHMSREPFPPGAYRIRISRIDLISNTMFVGSAVRQGGQVRRQQVR